MRRKSQDPLRWRMGWGRGATCIPFWQLVLSQEGEHAKLTSGFREQGRVGRLRSPMQHCSSAPFIFEGSRISFRSFCNKSLWPSWCLEERVGKGSSSELAAIKNRPYTATVWWVPSWPQGPESCVSKGEPRAGPRSLSTAPCARTSLWLCQLAKLWCWVFQPLLKAVMRLSV